jgi:hypothetical protein
MSRGDAGARAVGGPLPSAEELAAILDANGARPAPYWPPHPPPGYAPGWRQKDAYEARVAIERVTGQADPRVTSWRAYDQEVRDAWNARMRLVERVLAAHRSATDRREQA